MENLLVGVSWALSIILALFVGGYFPSYMSKKGENLATHEDIAKLVDQVAAVTTTTKEIEAKISGELWDRQRHWEMKRDAVFGVVQALLEADEALDSLARILTAEMNGSHRDSLAPTVSERCRKCISVIDVFNAKRVLALIVCGRDLRKALDEIHETLKLGATKLGNSDIKGYQELIPALKKQFATTLLRARRELGLEWQLPTPQSTVSSAAPSPAAQNPEADKPKRR